MPTWSPDSWRAFSYQQAAQYPNEAALSAVIGELSAMPPLVSETEILSLKDAIAAAGRGEAFLLQGGDCAESFHDCNAEVISNKLKILLQMSLVLFHGLQKPIVRIGRIAGQYAKPRSSDFEKLNDQTLPSYRGDLVNQSQFDEAARTPNPQLMLQAYHYAALTLNYIRTLLADGFADFEQPAQWDLSFFEPSAQKKEYEKIVRAIGQNYPRINLIPSFSDFYTSHEALHLHYEQALTREISGKGFYNLSTHLPWIGMRTLNLDSAHVELLSGIKNPIGLKIGPELSPDTLLALLEKLNPENEAGRILLISRMGQERIHSRLPPLIQALQTAGMNATWICDPMHGNTEMTEQGVKTRRFETILQELIAAMRIHEDLGSYLAGVHLELTGDNVTECLGGARGLREQDLQKAYHSLVDPRLNYEQSLEIALQLSHGISA